MQNEKIEIKTMKEHDLNRVMDIERLVFTAPWQRKGFESELGLNRFARYYVAYARDELLGYAGMWVVLDEAHLTTLAVGAENQRRGIGDYLLRYLLNKAAAEGATRMFLEVRPSNKPARSLYMKHGFYSYGMRKKYYYDEDALIMVNDNLAGTVRGGTVESR